MTMTQPEPFTGVTSGLARRLDALESESTIPRVMAQCLEAGDANDGATVA